MYGSSKGASGKKLRSFHAVESVTIHVKLATLDDHNFLARTPIHTFLDSMKIPLSLESIHI